LRALEPIERSRMWPGSCGRRGVRSCFSVFHGPSSFPIPSMFSNSVSRLGRVIVWHGMALVDGGGISGIRFHYAYLVRFGRQPPRASRAGQALVNRRFTAKLGVARSRRSGASQAQGSEATQRIAPGSPHLPLHCRAAAEVTAFDLRGARFSLRAKLRESRPGQHLISRS
jgi:hypothetical protein